MEFFQDDIFPPTCSHQQPTMTSSEWFSGQSKPPVLINLKPTDMELLSNAPVIVRETKKYEVVKAEEGPSKDQILDSYFSKMKDVKDGAVNKGEGVDESEWD
eukprot:TRINITY_DN6881_c0_g1_i2.p1 TRINITY_DN6881_c0_g1~~TRINITY_DN6881_c0_g1_i2.p1  ORF type:complete len:102 (+),score=33.17 TRINITY_DN6881_c0_g1_i2:150-455(+)